MEASQKKRVLRETSKKELVGTASGLGFRGLCRV